MARNIERDAREEARRRDQLISNGFRLFSERGIENVSLQEIATTSEVGVATLYNYYGNKTNLLVAISAKIWLDFWNSIRTEEATIYIENGPAINWVVYYCDRIMALYREKPEMLRFSSDYKTFICREGYAANIAKQQIEALKPIVEDFHITYERAKVDGSMRTDIPENEMLTTIALTMLSTAERYAQGIVWADDNYESHLNELMHLREMILMWCTAK